MTATHARRRAIALLALAALLGAALALAVRESGKDSGGAGPADALRYRPAQNAAIEARAAAGASHVLFAKSPGGVMATAARVAAWRPLVERAAAGVVDADTLEAIVFLESAGRSNAQASDDLQGAAGLTQILAETGRDLLGMKIDVKASERLTRGIARGRKVHRRQALRMRVDERFDPRKALAATVRYLGIAKRALERDDLAVVSYHMGIGNLQRALAAFGEGEVPYAQLYFDSGPLSHAAAWDVLSGLGDDSSTYYWRILAARRIMRLYRSNPAELRHESALQTEKASAEDFLRSPESTPFYADPVALAAARESGELRGLDDLPGVRVDRRMGELASRVGRSPQLYRALRPEALAVLRYIGTTVRAIAGGGTLVLTSTVRDREYQRVLAARNLEATRRFSQHTTGYAFDIARVYASRKQALAFQFVLDRLQAQNAIAWVREPSAIHVTVGPDSRRVGL
jgi:hypothetical protein